MKAFIKKLSLVALSGILSFIFTAQAEEKPDGATLHRENCIACHAGMTDGDGSLLYTRKDHRVTSFSSLETQVRRCENNLGLTWFDEQVFAVRDYLNENYYKYSTNPASKAPAE